MWAVDDEAARRPGLLDRFFQVLDFEAHVVAPATALEDLFDGGVVTGGGDELEHRIFRGGRALEKADLHALDGIHEGARVQFVTQQCRERCERLLDRPDRDAHMGELRPRDQDFTLAWK